MGAAGGAGAGGPKRKPKRMSVITHLSPRALVQVFLTLLALGSAIVAFIFSIIFRDYLTNQLDANFKGGLKSEVLPCIRSTLDLCANDRDDQCWDRCCPPGYTCWISPTVGLYCQDGMNVCGGGDTKKFEECLEYADIPQTCQTPGCRKKEMIHGMTLPAFVLAGAGVVIDTIDGVLFFAAPDAVVCKSFMNLASSCVKWIAFGVVLGAGTQEFMKDLYENQCFNKVGMSTVALTGEYLVSFVVAEVISALLSLVLAPISAYYGGKLIGVPYVK